jgi:hypothetical protein
MTGSTARRETISFTACAATTVTTVNYSCFESEPDANADIDVELLVDIDEVLDAMEHSSAERPLRACVTVVNGRLFELTNTVTLPNAIGGSGNEVSYGVDAV